MSTAQIVSGGVAAILLFWIVGAYNRLTALRGTLVQGFALVDMQLEARQALLTRLLDLLAPMLPNAVDRVHALRSACQQFAAAHAHARLRPSDAGAMQSLRLADEILSDARGRLPAQGVAGVDLGDLNAALGAADAALGFARVQFNTAVIEYNRAMMQFPTMMIAGLFGLRSAGQF
jgi:LemA protein